MKNGVLITFEGPEGAGKSTQIKLLKASLEALGHDVVTTFEPGGGSELSQRIRQLLLSKEFSDMCDETELFLMLAARVEHVRKFVLPNLCAGRVVLCDRFVDSTLAYQGYGRGVTLNIIRQMNRLAIRGRHPDLTLILDVPEDLGLQRAAAKAGLDRIESEDLDFHSRVRQGFLALAAQEEGYYLVDATRSIEIVQAEILQRVVKVLGHENKQRQIVCR